MLACLVLALAAAVHVSAAEVHGDLFSVGKPSFPASAPLEIYESDLITATLTADLAKLVVAFQQAYSPMGISGTGYSDLNLIQLAKSLAAAEATGGAAGEASGPDAGQCQQAIQAVEENKPLPPELVTGGEASLAETVYYEQQLRFLANCSLASKIDVVFLGDSLMQRWDSESFLGLCQVLNLTCANFGVPGQTVAELRDQIEDLTTSTCLAPRAWVLFSGSNALVSEGQAAASTIAQSLSQVATELKEVSCFSAVTVMGLLPVSGGLATQLATAGTSSMDSLNFGIGIINSVVLANPNASFVDCSAAFQAPQNLLMDGIHPTTLGYHELSRCLLKSMATAAELPKPSFQTNLPASLVKAQALSEMGVYTWAYSAWTCDVACGEGSATRNATCIDVITHEHVPADRCSAADSKSLNSFCNMGECPQVAWLAGRWGDCDKKCGGGVSMRTVECVNSLNDVMDDALCYGGAREHRPSAWKSCNQSPCPLLAMPEAQKDAYYLEIVSGPISEQLGLSDSSELGGAGASDTKPIDEEDEGDAPLGGVGIMADSSSKSDDDDDGDENSSQKAVYVEGTGSSDDGNGESYDTKSLKELLVCYRDSDCGSGYECEPFTCTKACAVYTNGQTVSPELKKRYMPVVPSFVYQKMYMAMIFRGIGGICYRKCHHTTQCNKWGSNGLCKDWYCKKVEGCHDYFGDYHVPSLEECGVNGLCKPGKCNKKKNSLSGVKINAELGVSSPKACPGYSVPSVSGCCGSGSVTANGTCCAMGSSVDKDGECCSADQLDACGVCGGENKAVDILGQCCATQLDGNGVCCPAGRQVDECGICGGWNSSCAVSPTYSVSAESMLELEQKIHSQLPQQLVDATGALGFEFNDVAVFNLTLDSMGAASGPVSAEVTYRIVPSTATPKVTVSSFSAGVSGIAGLVEVERTGVCGNGMCEVGEQTRDGSDGTCPTDCSWSGFVPCECSGHGICSAATGSCKCHAGYTGPECAWCDDKYISLGNDADSGRAVCVPAQLAGNLSTTVVRHGSETDWMVMTETVPLEEAQTLSSDGDSTRNAVIAVCLITIGCFLVLGIATAVVVHLAKRQEAAQTVRQEALAAKLGPLGSAPSNPFGNGIGRQTDESMASAHLELSSAFTEFRTRDNPLAHIPAGAGGSALHAHGEGTAGGDPCSRRSTGSSRRYYVPSGLK